MITSALLSLAPLVPPAAQMPDLPREIVSSPQFKGGLTIIDLDADGHLDAVYIGSDSDGSGSAALPNQLIVHWGISGGDFEGGQRFDLGLRLTSLEALDVDGDLDEDLMIYSSETSQFHAVLNGVMRDEITVTPFLTLDPDIRSFEFADVDGDGDDDIVGRRATASILNFEMVFIECVGPMTYAPGTLLVAAGVTFSDFVLADFDGDGDLDAAGGWRQNNRGRITQFTNNGNLPMMGPRQVELGANFSFYNRMVAEDLDGDLDPDIAFTVGAPNSETFAIIPNDSGMLTQRESEVTLAARGTIMDIRDTTGTGTSDVILTTSDGTLIVVPDQGGGTYVGTYIATPGFESATGEQLRDLDGDGRGDFVRIATRFYGTSAIEELTASLSVQLPGGPLAFGPPRTFDPSFGDPEGLTAADLTGDGMPDLAVTSRAGTNVGIHEGDGQGGFLPLRSIFSGNNRAQEIAHGDIDGDGDLDLVVDASDELLWLENNGAGLTWTEHPIITTSLLQARSLLVVDFDEDGDLDILRAVERFTNLQNRVVFFENTDSGSFASSILLAAPPSPEQIRAVTLADLNGDGLDDLLFGSNSATMPRLVWAPREPGGGIGAIQELDAYAVQEGYGAGYWDIIASDLDGDGDMDVLASSNGRPSRLIRLENQGGAIFTASDVDSWMDWFGVTEIELVDLDLDGVDDLVASTRPVSLIDSELGVYPGLGAGQFGPLESTASGFGFVPHLVASDLDRDGDVDFASVYFLDDRVSVYRNDLVERIGESYCGPAVPNSTGASAQILVSGSPVLGDNQARLGVHGLPAQSVGFFLASRTEGFVPVVPTSVGALCLGGTIGRYASPGQIQSSGSSGTFGLEIDLTALPQATGFASAMSGEQWHFQSWYRDAIGGVATSNFTNGVRASWD